jgi:hypothetical protein
MHFLRSLLILLVTTLALSACTAVYQRRFEVLPSQDLPLEERKQILIKYREFMKSNGYVGMARADSSADVVDFMVRDARSRVLPTSRISDTISTVIEGNGQLFVQLFRVTSYPPDDFSVEYLKDFTNLTQKYLLESSGKEVTVREVARK